MMRAFFIWLSNLAWAQRTITSWPLAWRVASRFIAGDTEADAVAVVRRLNNEGILATVDHLGEHTESEATAEGSVGDIFHILEALHNNGLNSNVSVKLSQFGLILDAELAYHNLRRVLQKARECQNFVRVDMEDSGLLPGTLTIILRAWEEGFDNLGAVIQSYLYRSEADVQVLLGQGIGIRLVKGAYQEPADVAYQKRQAVDENFDHLSEILIRGAVAQGSRAVRDDGRVPPLTAIASHDLKRIHYAEASGERSGLPKPALEFQMLYGIQRDLQKDLVTRGYPVRVYVPYGTHWYPYFMRRLAERPANVRFFLSSLLKR